jgi:hypothetical protein
MSYDASLLRVLNCFTDTYTLGFTEIAEILHFETDLAGYYLRKLQSQKLVNKVERGQYQISPLGKSVLAHTSQFSSKIATPRVSVMLVASYEDRRIVTRRAKQPFLDRIEWPTLPLISEEDLPEAAKQLAKVRLGVNAQPVLKGMFRRIDVHEDTVFDDKFFAVHTLILNDEQSSQLSESNEIGEILRHTKSELYSLKNAAKSLLDILEFSEGTDTYQEKRYTLSNSDLY